MRTLVHLVNDTLQQTLTMQFFKFHANFSDGVFGLAFKEVSITDQSSTPIDNLYDQKQIQERLACIKLNGVDEETGGEMIIGGCDVEADYWVPIANTGFWQVNITKLEVKTPDGEVKASFCEHRGSHPCIAVLDTGADDICMIWNTTKTPRISLKLIRFLFRDVNRCVITLFDPNCQSLRCYIGR